MISRLAVGWVVVFCEFAERALQMVCSIGAEQLVMHFHSFSASEFSSGCCVTGVSVAQMRGNSWTRQQRTEACFLVVRLVSQQPLALARTKLCLSPLGKKKGRGAGWGAYVRFPVQRRRVSTVASGPLFAVYEGVPALLPRAPYLHSFPAYWYLALYEVVTATLLAFLSDQLSFCFMVLMDM